MKLAKGISFAAGTGAMVLALAYLQATAAEPAIGGTDTDTGTPAAATQRQPSTTTAPRTQTQRRRSYSYQSSSSRARAARNRLPTWERADSKVLSRYGVYPY
ncbi:MAG: hypothetical protein HYX69_04225 [Planctomycetia bacterium]|nr:hypothetical protein [Planctomycetia bacterium]